MPIVEAYSTCDIHGEERLNLRLLWFPRNWGILVAMSRGILVGMSPHPLFVQLLGEWLHFSSDLDMFQSIQSSQSCYNFDRLYRYMYWMSFPVSCTDFHFLSKHRIDSHKLIKCVYTVEWWHSQTQHFTQLGTNFNNVYSSIKGPRSIIFMTFSKTLEWWL